MTPDTDTDAEMDADDRNDDNGDIEVDLSDPDDQHGKSAARAAVDRGTERARDEVEREISQAADDLAESETQTDGRQRSDVLDEAKNEAERLLDAADGQTEAERLQHAIEDIVSSVGEMETQLAQRKNSRQEAENRIERLQQTKDRVRDQPDEFRVLQTLGGGVSVEVPPDAEQTEDGNGRTVRAGYTRSDLADEVDETIEMLDERVDQMDGQITAMEQAIEKAQVAAQLLQTKHEEVQSDPRSEEAFREAALDIGASGDRNPRHR